MSQQSFIKQVKAAMAGNRAINGKAILAMIIFGMIILTFVLSDYSTRGNGTLGVGAAAEVNGEIITLKQFQEQENRIANYYAQFFGGKIDNEFQKKQIRSEALNELINNSLSAQAAEREKIYATDAELKKIIMEDLPYFKKDGVFQSDLYKNLLMANKLTPGEFEKDLRAQTKTQRIRQLFELGLSSSRIEKDLEAELKSKQMNVAFVKINADEIKKLITPESAAKNLTDPAFAQKVQDYYNNQKGEFETPEQVKASHILIRTGEGADEALAKAKMENIVQRLKKEDFGKVAGEVSEDPGSKTKKGDLGYFAKGRMVKEFEEAAFNTPVGKVSEIVKTPFGFHIIKVADKKPAQTTSFEAAKNGIAAKIQAEEANTAIAKHLEELVAKGAVAAVNEYINKSSLRWTESGYFDLTQDVLPQVNSEALFKASLELSKANPLAKVLVREGDAQYVLKLVDAKSVASTAPAKEDAAANQKSLSGYSKWISGLRKSAKVSTNDALLSQQ
ncbi:SurA N-terminal domain-containing protein [Pseudobdellovibrio sp. HCB154]|uniref:peptidylprolyl isomerase n=1 Tax=Pseudobdellovibrio sp. HCB154 TaxID=3386277 RepID=UPI003917118F